MTKSTYLIVAFLIHLAGAHANVRTHAQTKPVVESINTEIKNNALNIEITINSNYNHKELKVEYDRNFAQVIFRGLGIKSARVIPLSVGELDRVFLYQYEPSIVRMRIIKKNDSQFPRGIIKTWNSNKKSITVSVDLKQFSNNEKSLTVNTNHSIVSNSADVLIAAAENDTKDIERAVLKKIEQQDSIKKTEDSKDSKMDRSAINAADHNDDSQQLGVKADPSRSFFKMIASLIFVVGIFSGLVLLFKKYSDKFNFNKLPFGKRERLIQVVATHRLGKSQAISLVKVIDDYMVMGITGGNINLIAKLGKDADVGKYIEDRYWGGTFEKHLKDLEKENRISSVATMPGKAIKLSQTPSLKSYDGKRNLFQNDTADENSINHHESKSSVLTSTTGVRALIKKKLPPLKNLE